MQYIMHTQTFNFHPFQQNVGFPPCLCNKFIAIVTYTDYLVSSLVGEAYRYQGHRLARQVTKWGGAK